MFIALDRFSFLDLLNLSFRINAMTYEKCCFYQSMEKSEAQSSLWRRRKVGRILQGRKIEINYNVINLNQKGTTH